MAIVINRHATNVQAYFTFLNGRKRDFTITQRIVKLQHN